MLALADNLHYCPAFFFCKWKDAETTCHTGEGFTIRDESLYTRLTGSRRDTIVNIEIRMNFSSLRIVIPVILCKYFRKIAKGGLSAGV